MKALTVSTIALSLIGFSAVAQAQPGGKLFFEGDIVRGAQPGAPGPFCVLSSQFKRLEKVVFRIRVLDQNGTSLDDKGLKSLMVLLPDGTKLPSYFGPHPPPHLKDKMGPTTDHFWTSAWIVPEKYPSGTLVYKVVAADMQGQTHTWEPFKNWQSQFTIIAGAIEIKSK
jgi:hypothetical protein